jgi:hypothetical protein
MNDSEAPRSCLAALLERVRQASRDGAVLRLDEAHGGDLVGAGVSPTALLAFAEREHLDDLAIVCEGQHAYLYSTRYMTHQYAETAARVGEGDIPRLIAEAVRADSAIYPRPTPIGTFAERPFGLDRDQIALALERMLDDPGFDDIRRVTASDGTPFLFSARHLEPGHAASLAEWLAVGRSNNP